MTVQEGVIAIFLFIVFLGMVWWGFQRADAYKGER